jgi:hypothetical protein
MRKMLLLSVAAASWTSAPARAAKDLSRFFSAEEQRLLAQVVGGYVRSHRVLSQLANPDSATRQAYEAGTSHSCPIPVPVAWRGKVGAVVGLRSAFIEWRGATGFLSTKAQTGDVLFEDSRPRHRRLEIQCGPSKEQLYPKAYLHIDDAGQLIVALSTEPGVKILNLSTARMSTRWRGMPRQTFQLGKRTLEQIPWYRSALHDSLIPGQPRTARSRTRPGRSLP